MKTNDMFKYCKECIAVDKRASICLPCLATQLHKYDDIEKLVDDLKELFDDVKMECLKMESEE